MNQLIKKKVETELALDENFEVDGKPPKDFRPEHLKRMGVTISKGDVDE